MARFYITTTLPYVNAEPHIGFALEIIQADAIARYHRMLGDEVIFNTGTDEHGLKIYRNAVESGQEPQAYVDHYAAKFGLLKDALNLSFTHFIRTTDANHKAAAQEFWARCLENGAIYKKSYKIKYCVGCELEKTDSELVDGRCALHPNLAIEEIDEENYFFKFSAYQKELLAFYDKNPHFVLPESRFYEIRKFVEQGLNDFSISRLKSKMPWGVAIPGDDEQVMYVWFDALVNYVSTLGWPKDEKTFDAFWPGTQIAGKDNLRQQSAIWQAMLMAAGLANSQQVLIHGFITAEGQKMSKSLGNVVNPIEVAGKYGIDPLRYYLLREIPSNEDGDFSYKNLEQRYNSDLANGLGNLVQRVATLIDTKEGGSMRYGADLSATEASLAEVLDDTAYKMAFETFKLHDAAAQIWQKIALANVFINDNQPWKQEGAERTKTLTVAAAMIAHIAWLLQPFMPSTAERISVILGQTQPADLGEGSVVKINKTEPLFPRREA
jgi:methionyl-tRNA synthetase